MGQGWRQDHNEGTGSRQSCTLASEDPAPGLQGDQISDSISVPWCSAGCLRKTPAAQLGRRRGEGGRERGQCGAQPVTLKDSVHRVSRPRCSQTHATCYPCCPRKASERSLLPHIHAAQVQIKSFLWHKSLLPPPPPPESQVPQGRRGPRDRDQSGHPSWHRWLSPNWIRNMLGNQRLNYSHCSKLF